MLISQKHNFIFIHIYKTAGSSIQRALIPYCSNPVQLFSHRVLKRLGIDKLNPIPYSKHIKAPTLVEKMGIDEYKSYFSFAVVRNPWDWHVSLYKYMLKDSDHHQHEEVKNYNDFNEYIYTRCGGFYSPQKDFIYSVSGDKLVDYIARFEKLEEDFDKICSIIGIKGRKLPHVNISNSVHYREYYTNETRELIRKHYRKDIELFGYEF